MTADEGRADDDSLIVDELRRLLGAAGFAAQRQAPALPGDGITPAGPESVLAPGDVP